MSYHIQLYRIETKETDKKQRRRFLWQYRKPGSFYKTAEFAKYDPQAECWEEL